MNGPGTISAWFLLLMLMFAIAGHSWGLTGEEMERRIESYLAAEKSGDYATMAGLLGVGEEELRQALDDYLETLRRYFASRLNLSFKEIRFGGHEIIFVRPGKNEALVGQEVYVYLQGSGKLHRQHEYSVFRVSFDGLGHMRWQPLGSSRGDIEDAGRES